MENSRVLSPIQIKIRGNEKSVQRLGIIGGKEQSPSSLQLFQTLSLKCRAKFYKQFNFYLPATNTWDIDGKFAILSPFQITTGGNERSVLRHVIYGEKEQSLRFSELF